MNKKLNKFKDVFLIKNKEFKDKRGSFLKLQNKTKNQKTSNYFSFNKKKYTLRGLHFQKKPFQEIKIITCLKGSIFDVVVNVNKNSKNYLNWKSFLLTERNKLSLYVGKDYAHGFLTLDDNSVLSYQIIGKHSTKHQSGMHWNDKKIKIRWPHSPKIISARDKKIKRLC
jgi:dTDP-4-dehydrorhamnose 3,5-epimerase